jgi:hypothetical protein
MLQLRTLALGEICVEYSSRVEDQCAYIYAPGVKFFVEIVSVQLCYTLMACMSMFSIH